MYTVLDGCLNFGTYLCFPVRSYRLIAESLERCLGLLRLFSRCKVRQTVKLIEHNLFLNRALWAAHVKLSVHKWLISLEGCVPGIMHWSNCKQPSRLIDSITLFTDRHLLRYICLSNLRSKQERQIVPYCHKRMARLTRRELPAIIVWQLGKWQTAAMIWN